MKILIAGNGAFCTHLISRLNRERHDVYLVLGRENQDTEDTEKSGGEKCTTYYVNYNDEKLSVVISSVVPDAIIFLGDMDENYDWSLQQKASSSFMSGLSNLLCLAAIYEVSRFIYLSTTEVYGTEYNDKLTENLEKNPKSVKNLVISQAEDFCMGFNRVVGMKTMVLRLSYVYGMVTDKRDDFASMLFTYAMDNDMPHPFLKQQRMRFSPIYLSDAVDAVYKATVNLNGEAGIYNVAGFETDMSYVCKEIGKLTGEKKLYQEDSKTDSAVILTVGSRLFEKKYSYLPIVGIQAGLARMYKAFVKRSDKKAKESRKKAKKNYLKVISPFIETLFAFAVLAALSIFTSGNIYLDKIDFMVLFVVVASITFGLVQASISIILACALILWQNTENGLSILHMFTNTDTLLRMLQLFVIGTICGHLRDKMKADLDEKEQSLSDVTSELETIYEINDRNTKIKQMLDNRLINYENSLAKIYSITERLNSLQADQVFFSSINAVSEIMGSKDVSIYIVTDSAFKMCRLVAKSPESDIPMKKSIPLSDLGALAVCMERDEIYVNHDLEAQMPMMAAPIYSGRTLVSIIMLWTLKFEDLTIYNINNFLVLSKLISSIVEKAYVYTQSTSSISLLQDSDILNTEAFDNILKVHIQAQKDGIAQYRIFEVDVLGLDINEVTTKIKKMLRTTDYLGQGADGTLLLLLTNTTESDEKFVYDRLTKAAIPLKGANL